MILTRRYDLDIIPGGLPLLIRASRNDASSTLVFSLLVGEGVLDIPAGASATFRGATGSISGSLTFDTGIPQVTVNLNRSLTRKVGRIPFEIVLQSGNYQLVTATLYLDVR